MTDTPPSGAGGAGEDDQGRRGPAPPAVVPPGSQPGGYGQAPPGTGYGAPPGTGYGQPGYGQPARATRLRPARVRPARSRLRPAGTGYGAPAGGWAPPPQAPKPGVIPLRPIGVGEILDGSFTSIRRNPKATLGIAAVVLTISGIITTILELLLLSQLSLSTASSRRRRPSRNWPARSRSWYQAASPRSCWHSSSRSC